MRYNTDRSFAGVPAFKARHAEQVADFERWAAVGDWEHFHRSHYDWWAFPIDWRSAYGLKWTVYEGEIAELNADPEFVRRFLRGEELLAASWGWDLGKADYLPSPARGQSWHQWPVRLYKAALSARLFGHADIFESWKKYALILMNQGEVFEYNGHDLTWLFTTGVDPRANQT
jgi:hypothetical protein